ncbi:MAG: undecaprenyl-diphosphate phosphatase [Acidimicrobiales bacterium]
MSIFRAVILGIVQGLTEFLPISSSGHLQLVPWLFDWKDFEGNQDLANAFDIALHIGTLVGAVAYFWSDILRYLRAGVGSLSPANRTNGLSTDARVGWLLIVATIPAGITGVFLEEVLKSDDKIWLTATVLAVFGVVLALADRLRGERKVDSFQLKDALAIGIGQALALQPGVSRSGITITVARILKFDRVNATRLSFLMSLPIIAGAGLFKYVDIGGLNGIPSDMKAAFAAGMIASAITGFLAVWGLLKILAKATFNGFALYRVMAAIGIFIVLFVR